jgi:hypothetical protein
VSPLRDQVISIHRCNQPTVGDVSILKFHRPQFDRETRAPLTVRNHLTVLKRVFREGAPAIFVEGAHAPAPDDHRPHPVVDTGGVATALPLTTKAQLRSFLHRYHEALAATADALPVALAGRAHAALHQLVTFAGNGVNAGRRRRRAKAEAKPSSASSFLPSAPSSSSSTQWVLQGKKKAELPPTAARRRDLWARLVSPALEEQFKELQRCVGSTGAIADTWSKST